MPLRLREIDPRRFAVTGTPTDCVMMACAHVMKDAQPTLILSGVNRGSNLADDVTYSGTIAGAMEGCALGIPSVALSQSYGFEPKSEINWSCGETHGPALIRKLVDIGWPQDVKGTEITMQGKRDMQTAALDRRIDARGFPYFWIGFKRVRSNPPIGSDLCAIYEKRISVTPLHLNLTEQGVLKSLREAFAK